MSIFNQKMIKMDSRKRFEITMNHEQPDRVPIDIGATTLTSIRPKCQEQLLQYLGMEPGVEKNSNGVDEKILEWAGTDFRSVGAIIDLPSSHTQKVSHNAEIDCWGIRRDFIGGDWQITKSPLKGASIEDLKSFKWPEPHVNERLLMEWEKRAKSLKENNKYVVVAEHPVYGILELGCWMCGFDDFLLKILMEPDFIHFFFEKVLEIQLQVSDHYYSVLGPFIDLTTSGDDFGTQNAPFISPDMFQAFVAPYFSERIKRTKDIADCYFWHHSCGSVVDLLDQLIECGVDILNPVQTSAKGMEPEILKSRFGDKITFWGAVDVQHFLPFAEPSEIPREIKNLIKVMGEGGGFVMAPAHEIQEDVPAENIVKWVETVKSSV
jgi:uroporphyrinogen decarboxylase